MTDSSHNAKAVPPYDRRTAYELVGLAVCVLTGIGVGVWAVAAKVSIARDVAGLPDEYAAARTLFTTADVVASLMLLLGTSVVAFGIIGVFTDRCQRRSAWLQFATFVAFLLAGNASSLLVGYRWGYALGLVALVAAAVLTTWLDSRRWAMQPSTEAPEVTSRA